MPLQRHAHADADGLLGRHLAGELTDVLGRDAGDPRRPFGRTVGGALLQLLVADRVVVHVVLVDEALRDDRVDQRHGEGAVRAGLRRDVPVGRLGGSRRIGVDHDDLGALLLGILDDGPMMQVRADAVARPDHDVLRVDVAVGVETGRRADRQQPGRARSFAAEGALGHRGAHAVEEGVAAVQPVHEPLVAEIAVGHDGFRPVLVDDRLPARHDRVEGFVPGDALELLRALRSDPLHWIEQPVGMVVPLLVVFQFHAETAAGHRVVRVALHTQQLAVLDLEQHRAGVRAVVRAAAEEGLRQGRGAEQSLGIDDLVHVSPAVERPAFLSCRVAQSSCLLSVSCLRQFHILVRRKGQHKRDLWYQRFCRMRSPVVASRQQGHSQASVGCRAQE